MAIFLKVDGITGSAEEANHKQWIVLDSLQFGSTRNVSARVGGGVTREFSAPSMTDVTISKPLDISSGAIFREAVTGSQGRTWTIDVTSTGQGGQTLLEYILSNVFVSNYHISTGGDQPMESLSLNYTMIVASFTPPGGGPVRITYDLSSAQAS